VRSESPAFDLHHPEIAALEMVENEELRREGDRADAPDVTGRRGHLEQQLGSDVESTTRNITENRDEDGR
jgi:cytochrome c oxidase subunit 1